MIHLGDITKIDGHKVPLVDIVTGGSPCQDLSVAGARAGLQGERSGLFMEQIRIIKEMRDESRRRISVSGAKVRNINLPTVKGTHHSETVSPCLFGRGCHDGWSSS